MTPDFADLDQEPNSRLRSQLCSTLGRSSMTMLVGKSHFDFRAQRAVVTMNSQKARHLSQVSASGGTHLIGDPQVANKLDRAALPRMRLSRSKTAP